MADMEERKADMLARLEAKHADRLAKAAARREGSAAERDPTQTPTVFWNAFSRKYERIKPEMDKFRSQCRIQGVNEENRPSFESQLSEWAVLAQELQKSIADATLYLPPYDIRQAQGQVAEMKAGIEGLRSEIMPRKKFRFKTRERRKAAGAGGHAEVDPALAGSSAEEAESKVDSTARFVPDEYGIEDKKDEEIFVPAGTLAVGQDIRLAELSNCCVVLCDTVNAVRADNLVNCHVYTGPVAGSLLLHNCTDCVFFLTSRQIRLHTSTRCDFYLNVKSRPIIEDCTKLRFAPYNVSYPLLESQLEAAGLPAVGSSNMWSKVDDFKWHRIQHSPNWSILPLEERLTALTRTSKVTLSLLPEAATKPIGTVVASPAPAPKRAEPTPEPEQTVESAAGDEDEDSDDDEL